MSQMRFLWVDIIAHVHQYTLESESPDGRIDKDRRSWWTFSWNIRKFLKSGDRKIQYWLADKLLTQISEAGARIFLEDLKNPFLELSYKQNVFFKLENAIKWESWEPEDIAWLKTAVGEDWESLYNAGYDRGEYGQKLQNPTAILVWWTDGAFNRGEPAEVFHPTLHGIYSQDMLGMFGRPNISRLENSPQTMKLDVIKT